MSDVARQRIWWAGFLSLIGGSFAPLFGEQFIWMTLVADAFAGLSLLALWLTDR